MHTKCQPPSPISLEMYSHLLLFLPRMAREKKQSKNEKKTTHTKQEHTHVKNLLPAMYHNLRHAGRAPPATAFTTPACCSVNRGSQARYRLRIAISAYPTCIRRPRQGGGGSRRSVAISFGAEKLECCGYPTVKKN